MFLINKALRPYFIKKKNNNKLFSFTMKNIGIFQSNYILFLTSQLQRIYLLYYSFNILCRTKNHFILIRFIRIINSCGGIHLQNSKIPNVCINYIRIVFSEKKKSLHHNAVITYKLKIHKYTYLILYTPIMCIQNFKS